jgi:hypothetical protein
MQITDKQVEAALKQLPFDYPTTLQPYVVRRMIEAAMQAAWVNVDDTLPDKDKDFHISDRFLVVLPSNYKTHVSGYTKEKRGSVYKSNFDFPEVTHWMPMPCFKELA